MTRALSITAILALELCLVTGCRATIPDGRFACTVDADCPPGQSCTAGVCRAVSSDDGGVDRDGSRPDGGACACDDGQFCNGVETCAGTECIPGDSPCAVAASCDEVMDRCEGDDAIRVRIVHGSFRVDEDIRVLFDGSEVATLAYGTVSAPISIPKSGAIEVVVQTIDGGLIASTAVTVTGSTILVLGPQTADAGEALYSVLDNLPAASPDPAYRVLSVMATADRVQVGNMLFGDPLVATWLEIGQSTDVIVSTGGGANATIMDFAGESLGEDLAGFTTALVESAWIVLFGDLRTHPGSPQAVSAVVVDSDGTRLEPEVFLQVLNATADDQPVHLCPIDEKGDPAGEPALLTARNLRGAFVYPPELFQGGYRAGPDGATACSDTALPSFQLVGLDRRERHLFVITGPSTAPRITRIADAYAAHGFGDMATTRLSFTHLASESLPTRALQLFDTDASPRLMLLSTVSEGVSTFGTLPSSIVEGMIAMADPGVATPLASGSLGTDDTTDALHLIYTDSTTGNPARLVRAPHGRPWTAALLGP